MEYDAITATAVVWLIEYIYCIICDTAQQIHRAAALWQEQQQGQRLEYVLCPAAVPTHMKSTLLAEGRRTKVSDPRSRRMRTKTTVAGVQFSFNT